MLIDLFAIVPYFLKGTKVTNQSLLFKSIVHFSPEPVVHYMPECPRGLCSAPRQKKLFYLKNYSKVVHFAPESVVHITPEWIVQYSPEYSVNAEGASFFEGLEAFSYICKASQFFGILARKIRKFLYHSFYSVVYVIDY